MSQLESKTDTQKKTRHDSFKVKSLEVELALTNSKSEAEETKSNLK